MADAKGVVTELDGEYALVQMDEGGCGRCHEAGGCGGQNIGRFLCRTPRVFRVLNSQRASVGERVHVTVPDGVVAQGALIAYAVPLAGLFAGAFCGQSVADEQGAVIGAIAGLVGMFLVGRSFGRKGGLRHSSIPRASRVDPNSK